MRLWDTGSLPVDETILHFTVGDDPQLDRQILPFDCIASAAHAEMLHSIKILTDDEHTRLQKALKKAYHLAIAGEFAITAEQEDGHTALEQFLTEACGDAGQKIHTGRSRNDQVIAAVRLWARQTTLDLVDEVLALAQSWSALAEQHRAVLMPGYTHTRQAMPSTVGQLFGAFAEGLVRDMDALRPALDLAQRSALGSASGYGVPLPLDRPRVAKSLGLQCSDQNTLYTQNSRGKLEAAVLFGLHQIALTVGRFATDLIWFSSEGFGFFSLPNELTTGSSIMPQKRNPDLFELMRGVPASMLARYTEVTALLHGMPMGYHRDLQRTKAPMLQGMAEMRQVLVVMQLAAKKIEINKDNKGRLATSIDDATYATDHTYSQVREGVPFREAYRAVKQMESAPLNEEAVLMSRTHLGAPGTPQTVYFAAAVREIQDSFQIYKTGVHTAQKLLV